MSKAKGTRRRVQHHRQRSANVGAATRKESERMVRAVNVTITTFTTKKQGRPQPSVGRAPRNRKSHTAKRSNIQCCCDHPGRAKVRVRCGLERLLLPPYHIISYHTIPYLTLPPSGTDRVSPSPFTTGQGVHSNNSDRRPQTADVIWRS